MLISSNTITILLLANLLSCFWIRVNSYVTNDNLTDYVNAIYFLFTTASTIGYGDILVDHKRTDTASGRYLFATFMILMSLIFFAYVQSLINSMRAEWTLVDDRLQGLLEEFVDWMTNRTMASGGRIPFKFETSLIDFFDYLYTNDIYSTVSMNGFIDLLGEKLKMQLTKITAKGVVDRYVFLADVDDDIAAEIVLNSEAVSFVEGDKIITRGQTSEAIYLVLKGKVSVLYPPENLKIDLIEEKEHFGDICLLSKKSHFDYVCHSSVVCLQIKHATISELLVKNRAALSRLAGNAKLRLKYMLFMKNKAVVAKRRYEELRMMSDGFQGENEFVIDKMSEILNQDFIDEAVGSNDRAILGKGEADEMLQTDQKIVPHGSPIEEPEGNPVLATEADELLLDYHRDNNKRENIMDTAAAGDISIQEVPKNHLITPKKFEAFNWKGDLHNGPGTPGQDALKSKSMLHPTDSVAGNSIASTGVKGIMKLAVKAKSQQPDNKVTAFNKDLEVPDPNAKIPELQNLPDSKLRHLKSVFTKNKLSAKSKPNMIEMLAQMATSKAELDTSFNSVDVEDSKVGAAAMQKLLDKADAVTQHKLMEVETTEKVVFGVTVGEALFEAEDEQDDSCEMDHPVASVQTQDIELGITYSLRMAEAKLQHVKCKFRVFLEHFRGDFEFVEDEIRVKTNKLIRIETNHSKPKESTQVEL